MRARTGILCLLVGLSACAFESQSEPQAAAPSVDDRASEAEVAVVRDDAPDARRSVEARPSQDGDAWNLLYAFFYGGDTLAQQQAAIENLTAECMRERGWRYTPYVDTVSGAFNTLAELRDFRRTYGYGILNPVEEANYSRDNDPNVRYIEGLSNDARHRYYTDLNDGHVPEERSEELPAADASGCRPKAEREVRLSFPEANEEVRQAVAALDLNNRPEMHEAWRDWADCMQQRGYTYSSPSEAQKRFGGKQGETGPGDLTGEMEIAVATADVECYIAGVHPVQRLLEIEALMDLAERFPEYAPFITVEE